MEDFKLGWFQFLFHIVLRDLGKVNIYVAVVIRVRIYKNDTLIRIVNDRT